MPYIGNTVQNQGFTPAIDYFSGNGSTVTFTLSRPLASVAQIICAIDNVIQNPSSAYTVSGSSITFTSAPLSGTNNIWVEYTSLITTYAAISQSPSVIGDITATGGYLATGSFGNSFIDGTIIDYVTGNGRITVGPVDGFTIYNNGTSSRVSLLALNANGALGVGTSPSYGTSGQVLTSGGSSAAPTWTTIAAYTGSTYGVQYLTVAGGGGGGAGRGGGGGGGGFLTGQSVVTSGTAYTITVGAGGNGGSSGGPGTSGGNSVFTGIATAIGGGYGGGAGSSRVGGTGGSGGGNGDNSVGSGLAVAGGSGTTNQGTAGGSASNTAGAEAGGGGGGASTSGQSCYFYYGGIAGSGGAGAYSAISGSSVWYSGGGGGGGGYNGGAQAGNGGQGGGGQGAGDTGHYVGNAVAGTANTGGGGGAGSNSRDAGAAGGSGIVIISYVNPTQKGSGGTVTSYSGPQGLTWVHTFTTSGTYTA